MEVIQAQEAAEVAAVPAVVTMTLCLGMTAATTCPSNATGGESERGSRFPVSRIKRLMAKIYISGPISGIDRAVYLSAFAEAERRLRAKGYDTLNPTRLPPSRWLWIYKLLGYRLTLLYDLWHLMRCDGITMLAGWEHSRGARLEKATADIFNIKEITL